MENPWALLCGEAPFVQEIDRPALASSDVRVRGGGNAGEFEFHLDLLPSPFIGNPLAPVVLLSLNPGFNERDANDYARADFSKAARLNLTHEIPDFPFFPINPKFSNTATFGWWRPRLRSLIEDAGEQSVARNIVCLQAVGYHSYRFGGGSLLLPSQAYTHSLLADAIRRKAVIVGTRARRHWERAMPDLRTYNRIWWLRSTRSAYVSPGNLDGSGYAAMVAELRASR